MQIDKMHTGMNHSNMQKDYDVHMGMSEHDHRAMIIADFKKRFYVVLALTIPIMLLSTMIQHFMGVNWAFPRC